MEMLEEISETMEYCRREYELYPNARIKGLVEKLYLGLIAFCQQSLKLMQASSFKRASLEILGATREEFQNSISNIRKISASVMREVEYLNRVELREAHARLRNMERDQQRMLLAMEDQKKIMLSLKEERKITTMINDQQTILQTVQNLQMKVSALDPAFFVLRGNE
jgi:serine kinase of HPr protein (carbohydrate metabolism regulator)